MLTFKRKLILTVAQAKRIDSWIGACRTVYNLSLEIRKEAYKNKGTTPHKFELMKQLTEIRDIPWINDVPRVSLDNAIVRLDNAYLKFFKGAGFPKWASKKSYTSLTLRNSIHVKDNKLSVSKMGAIKMIKDKAIVGNIKIVVIKRELTGYYACIITDAAKTIQNQDENQVLGIDMGIAKFATDSKGRFIDNPRHFKSYEKKLRIENRSLSRKKKGGKNWLKQAKKLSLLHHRIGNLRRDFLHKESTRIAKENHTVILEDLNIIGMVKNNLSKHILDAGWGMFRRMLEYKISVIAINPKFTSQTCNSCGSKDAVSRISQSKFVCTTCGVEAHADHNAALNILGKGLAYIRERKALA